MNIPISDRLGKYLKARRRAIGLSQREVSKVLGYPNVQSICNWEAGKANPPPKKFRKLLKIYEISPEEFLSILLSEIGHSLRKFL